MTDTEYHLTSAATYLRMAAEHAKRGLTAINNISKGVTSFGSIHYNTIEAERWATKAREHIFKTDELSASRDSTAASDNQLLAERVVRLEEQVKALTSSTNKTDEVATATQYDLLELLKFAFAAGVGRHPMNLSDDDLARWEEFTPCPRSTFQRVEHAVKIQEAK